MDLIGHDTRPNDFPMHSFLEGALLFEVNMIKYLVCELEKAEGGMDPKYLPHNLKNLAFG